jgi:hypothetical protein
MLRGRTKETVLPAQDQCNGRIRRSDSCTEEPLSHEDRLALAIAVPDIVEIWLGRRLVLSGMLAVNHENGGHDCTGSAPEFLPDFRLLSCAARRGGGAAEPGSLVTPRTGEELEAATCVGSTSSTTAPTRNRMS